jgi:ABC-type transport system involved in multi-copper enzyme maturation permease subunit
LPSRRSPVAALFEKEWRELMASRAWWVMLIAMGPLVGMSFISAVTAYGELSSNAAGVGEAFSPLIGIWAPTFSACELAAAFLLPFVGIRLVSGDKQSGALKMELQHPLSSFARLSIKTIVLLCGWLIATIAPLIGVALWISYGGSVYAPELATVIAGHILNGALTIALAAAAAALTEHPATAAIVTLTITVGTWLINFAAAVSGGWWERAAAFTPTAMVAEFQRGLWRADVTVAVLALTFAGLALGSIWLNLGEPFRRRLQRSVFAVAIALVALVSAAQLAPSWDASESRRNSFPESAVDALRSIDGQLSIVAHFAPEDPRRSDLEHNAFRKLRRALPRTKIRYQSATSTGLFEQTSESYGQIDYSLDGRSASSRITTVEGVLESVFTMAGIDPPAESDDDIFRGHPLAAAPRGAAVIFYGAWPVAIAAIALVVQRRSR